MSKPHIHARSSARKYGGKWEDYLSIHEFLDASKAVIADPRHRALTHNAWFISFVLPQVFGHTFTNSEGKTISVRDIGEQHVAEDFKGFIPSAADYLTNMDLAGWMYNGAGGPPSMARILKGKKSDEGRTEGEEGRVRSEAEGAEQAQSGSGGGSA